MKTSIALVSAALLLGAALARPTPDLRRPSPPKPPRATPPAEAFVETPEATSFLDTVVGALLPSPEPEPIKEFIGIVSPGFTTNDRINDEHPDLLAIHRKLDTMKVEFAFERTPYEDILAYLRDVSGLNILLDAEVDRSQIYPPVTIRLRDVTIRKAIRATLDHINTSLDILVTEEKAILITARPPGAPISEPPPIRTEPELYGFDAVLAATRVSLDVQNAPMAYIVEVLRERTGLDIQLSGHHEEYISFKAFESPLPMLLTRLLWPRDLVYTVDGVTVRIGRIKGN